MTITVNFAPVMTFVAANPAAVLAFIVLIGVILPGVWSRRGRRRRAAVVVVREVGNAIATIVRSLR